MNKALQILNLLGILALSVLCCFQWRENSRQIRAIDALEKTRTEQTAKIAQQDRTIQNDQTNLEDLRDRFTKSQSELKESQGKVTSLIAERDQLKAEIPKWQAAVAERDEVIKQRTEQIKKSQDDRNDAVKKFNELADKYNALVKSVNDAK